MNIGELVQRVQEVCPLPATAQRVAQLCASDKARIDQVASVIATDPSLAAVTMRIANSAAFGRTRAVSQLEDAVLIIGLGEIHRMAMALALLAAFPAQHELEFGFHDRSTLAGSVARVVAARTADVPRGEAFLCGLLCEIGAMACAVVDAAEYKLMWEDAGADLEKRMSLETARYGATSMQIGGELLRRNDLPELVAAGVEQSRPGADVPPLARMTAFARAASMALVDAGKDGDRERLKERLAAASAASAISVPIEELETLCLSAADTAAKAMRAR